MTKIKQVSDFINPDTGKTYREENNELKHTFKIGDLVEIKSLGDDVLEDWEYGGMRLYVIGCTRDCDGTPLYVLGTRDMELYQDHPRIKIPLFNQKSFSGFSERHLKLIKHNIL